jgi:hypothetical protein
VCCGRKFFEGDVREDPDKITGKEKPLCPNCAEHGKLREKLFDEERLELKQKLQRLADEIPSCINCEYYWGDWEENGHCGLSEQQHIDSTRCLKDKFLNALPKKFGELLKEEKEAKTT